jgi:hypothetical protein
MHCFVHLFLYLQAASPVLALSFYQYRDAPLQLNVTSSLNGSAFGTKADNGSAYGFLQIINNCNYQVNAFSVGAHHLLGPRDPTKGFGTAGDEEKHTIPPGEMYTEPFRMTCPLPKGWDPKLKSAATNATGYQVLINPLPTEPNNLYCIAEDKLAGQGISVKIAKTDLPSGDILQLEYAIVMDPNRGDTFQRMNYDVSLLNCAARDNITDFSATTADHDEKIALCPGYDGGLSLTFDNDTQTENCPPTYCDGKDKCLMAYMWDKTRQGESSLGCEREYFGNMTLNLCVGNAADEFAG